jgi:uncharacterized protein (DUF1501 family)
MKLIQPELHSRRAFLRRSGQLALTGTALPFALNLAAMGEAAAFNATDYKALVCVFLNGGNDYANTVVTYDTDSYSKYLAVRGGGTGGESIALPRDSLAATLLNPTMALPNGRQYALHPVMTRMANLFNTGKAAVQLNVGPLLVPLTRTQYSQQPMLRPPQLFSHNDQQSVWQTSSPEGSTKGWGGHMGDLALSSNGNSLFTCISVSGNAVFLSGDQALSYQVNSGGAQAIRPVTDANVYGSTAVKAAITQLVRQQRAQVLENEYNRVTVRSIDSQVQIANTIADGTAKITTTMFANDNLSSQMRTVARLIGGRNISGAKRQVFFVSMGGFDLHDNLIAGQAGLMTRLSDAMTSFYEATVELGVADKVTAFTASDFGRTLSSNGDGSDHGWGGHHFMVGGAVKGKAFYGSAPPVSVTNTTAPEDQWHVGQGRLLPSTSVDQYAATLARWFGVSDTEMPGILPNLSNFGSTAYPRYLSFL